MTSLVKTALFGIFQNPESRSELQDPRSELQDQIQDPDPGPSLGSQFGPGLGPSLGSQFGPGLGQSLG